MNNDQHKFMCQSNHQKISKGYEITLNKTIVNDNKLSEKHNKNDWKCY